MRQPEKMIIYNLFPLLAGTFESWEGHLKRAAEMGFNWIFVNPVNLPGLSGSLYSIKDYFSLNPLLINKNSNQSPDEQIKEAIRTAENLGLRMMIDLVINHCSVDSLLIKEHPQWFQWEKKGKVAHPFANENGKKVVWGDLAKFDHRNTRDGEGLYHFFFEIVQYLVELGFHGFRCDAAYQLPGRLWERLIRETKKRYPDTLFFAETLGCTSDQTRKTASAGFDYIFNSSKWWDFKSPWLMEQYNLTRETAPSVSFPESHDTQRLFDELKGNIDGIKQRYLLSALFSAGTMMPIGFEFGFRNRLHVVKTRPDAWEETGVDLTHFIGKVNRIKEQYTIFQEDAPTEILYADNPNILIMWKASTHTQEEALLILNKDIQHHQHFEAKSLYDFMQSGSACTDVSPEYSLDFIPEPFAYDLRPGQGIVFVAMRDPASED
jgi:starch synthase (maltosyl-transferring)